MLDDRFRKNSKAAGQVLDKATRFYLAALEKMQRPISPHFKVRKARAVVSRKPSRTTDGKFTRHQTGQTAPVDPNLQHIRLQLLDKPDVTITLPGDFDAADWTFLKPILEAYIARLTGPTSKP
jgi:predicted metalloprotease